MIANKSSPFARKCAWPGGDRGWGGGCGYHGNCRGSQFLAIRMTQPLFEAQFNVPFPCLAIPRQARPAAPRFRAVPTWMMDQSVYLGPRDAQRKRHAGERAWCQLKIINDMREFWAEFDDENCRS
jgi:hypothetical protein